MPKRIQQSDPHQVELASIVYLEDGLNLVLTLTRSMLVKYGISYRWLRVLEMRLVSALHQMEERGQLLSYLVECDTKVMREMPISSSAPYITSWRQLILDDPLCEGLPSPTDFYTYYVSPAAAKKAQER